MAWRGSGSPTWGGCQLDAGRMASSAGWTGAVGLRRLAARGWFSARGLGSSQAALSVCSCNTATGFRQREKGDTRGGGAWAETELVTTQPQTSSHDHTAQLVPHSIGQKSIAASNPCSRAEVRPRLLREEHQRVYGHLFFSFLFF